MSACLHALSRQACTSLPPLCTHKGVHFYVLTIPTTCTQIFCDNYKKCAHVLVLHGTVSRENANYRKRLTTTVWHVRMLQATFVKGTGQINPAHVARQACLNALYMLVCRCKHWSWSTHLACAARQALHHACTCM